MKVFNLLAKNEQNEVEEAAFRWTRNEFKEENAGKYSQPLHLIGRGGSDLM